MNSRTRVFLTVLSTAVGGSSLILYTTISQDILFKGLSFCSSSVQELVFGSAAFFLSAVVAGFISTLIVVKDNVLPLVFISLFVVAKIFLFTACGQWHGPIWFETGLNLSHLGGLWLGCYGAVKFPLAPM
ncbi:hypothetical protein [Flagellimonas flava]|uniref:Uncharacterized protein n=1 Tax=Flagellimonas flava TaxID=570519 RepID=A0A1M5IFI0_9FLAO|nr:hypothetical protein [Allomuricauda flava]SHG26660.1 hypothetical protein SAMN04488116_0651 [Allomuricauda flava]